MLQAILRIKLGDPVTELEINPQAYLLGNFMLHSAPINNVKLFKLQASMTINLHPFRFQFGTSTIFLKLQSYMHIERHGQSIKCSRQAASSELYSGTDGSSLHGDLVVNVIVHVGRTMDLLSLCYPYVQCAKQFPSIAGSAIIATVNPNVEKRL